MPDLKCTHCGKTNPDDSQFCQYCGSQLMKLSFKDDLYEELLSYLDADQSKLYRSNADYGANTNLIVLKTCDTFKLKVWSYGDYRITCDEDVKDIISYSWGDWNNDSVDLYITGIKQGTTLLEFTKESSSSTFYVLIAVLGEVDERDDIISTHPLIKTHILSIPIEDAYRLSSLLFDTLSLSTPAAIRQKLFYGIKNQSNADLIDELLSLPDSQLEEACKQTATELAKRKS